MPLPIKISSLILKKHIVDINSLERRYILCRTFSSNFQTKIQGEEAESICGPPLIRSPFSPDRQIVRPPIRIREAAKNFERFVSDTAEPFGSKAQKVNLPEPEAATTSAVQSQSPKRALEDDFRLETEIETANIDKMKTTTISATQIDEPLKYAQEKEQINEEESRRRQETHWRGVKWGIYILLTATVSGIVYIFITHGYAPTDPVTKEVIKDQYYGTTLAPLWRVFDYMTSWKSFIAEPTREKLLPDPVKPPWHQPKYTVVMEMRNVLVNPEWNYKKGHYFVKRTALNYFMDVVGYPNFELVIYTSENMMNSAPIVAQIDSKGNRINHVLFRDCTKYQHGIHIKDLSRLNRDLSKVIYIDWEPAAFQLNTENVLRVPKWDGSQDDTYLVDLAELLKTIHLSDVDDVRPVLQFYSQFDNPMAEFRRRAQTLAQETVERQSDAATAVPPTQDNLLKKYRGNLFGARRHSV